ncbi:hypothetical protein BO79DRAFT_42031 [Aspergillus costaricaensis CBS 115574]|uniref:Uncharacterized protein n=1 Tax=Aspergillus costaricaensis CBS 115574 TaxID=1448317 RepID=A0ACD1IR57_9EURO|nr:hypothetical protein BO79DRAFT_42031 [Aspergillus costaricaensis CBS 115574]RAK92962.1 hypothetical protein BO79DRAFT_42031 [Aspergillus costaricaensis CBS 115574]
MAMQNTVLLQQELNQLRAVDQYKKNKKKASKRFLQEGGILDGSTARHITQKKDVEAIQITKSIQHRPPRCSNYNREGHNRLKCPDKVNT